MCKVWSEVGFVWRYVAHCAVRGEVLRCGVQYVEMGSWAVDLGKDSRGARYDTSFWRTGTGRTFGCMATMFVLRVQSPRCPAEK